MNVLTLIGMIAGVLLGFILARHSGDKSAVCESLSGIRLNDYNYCECGKSFSEHTANTIASEWDKRTK